MIIKFDNSYRYKMLLLGIIIIQIISIDNGYFKQQILQECVFHNIYPIAGYG